MFQIVYTNKMRQKSLRELLTTYLLKLLCKTSHLTFLTTWWNSHFLYLIVKIWASKKVKHLLWDHTDNYQHHTENWKIYVYLFGKSKKRELQKPSVKIWGNRIPRSRQGCAKQRDLKNRVFLQGLQKRNEEVRRTSSVSGGDCTQT